MLEEIISTYPSKAAFCRAVGIRRQMLTQIENGSRPITPKMALAMNRLHGVALEKMRPDVFGVDDAA